MYRNINLASSNSRVGSPKNGGPAKHSRRSASNTKLITRFPVRGCYSWSILDYSCSEKLQLIKYFGVLKFQKFQYWVFRGIPCRSTTHKEKGGKKLLHWTSFEPASVKILQIFQSFFKESHFI